jgi:hypothetical protein
VGHRSLGIPADATLPAGYVGAHVDHGYARTVDTAQGATVDHSLFAPSTPATAERAYVALSRGRLSNRIYATCGRAWIDAMGQRRGHHLAVEQAPDSDRVLGDRSRLGPRGPRGATRTGVLDPVSETHPLMAGATVAPPTRRFYDECSIDVGL